MKMIAGWVEPDSGTIEIGQTVRMGYFSQENEEMDETLRVIDYIKNVAEYVKTRDGSISASQMLERFLFPSHMQYTVIGKLSGGERRRLYLLRILMDAPNVILLDEPTNDLDIQTLTILEDYLDSFQGIVVTVSHDRYFLDRVVRRIFAFEGDGEVRQYEGGFTDYQAALEQRLLRGDSDSGIPEGQKDRAGSKAAGKDGDLETDGMKASSEATRRQGRKLKFSYKEQKEWESIEEEISLLEEEIQDLEKKMEGASSNYGKLQELIGEKEQKEAKLEERMDRWMYLNELAEKIAAQ